MSFQNILKLPLPFELFSGLSNCSVVCSALFSSLGMPVQILFASLFLCCCCHSFEILCFLPLSPPFGKDEEKVLCYFTFP